MAALLGLRKTTAGTRSQGQRKGERSHDMLGGEHLRRAKKAIFSEHQSGEVTKERAVLWDPVSWREMNPWVNTGAR